ncbi:hydrophobin-2 [Trichoderma sp. SZMC 28013]
MKFFTAAALFATSAMAAVCPEGGLYTNPVCCASLLLDVLGVDCHTPTTPINTPGQFQSSCASHGGQAACCAVPVAGQGVLCIKPAGTA